jgi:hypothetical protein
VAPPVLAIAVLLGGVPAAALGAYQASIDVNTTAFNPPCDDDPSSIVPKMQTAAKAAYARLNYAATAYTGKAFTRPATLTRTPNDWGYYVHSHGDFTNADGHRYTGFREDSGTAHSTSSRRTKAKRWPGQQPASSRLTPTERDPARRLGREGKATRLQGPEFYTGYRGLQWDSDEWIFDRLGTLAGGRSVGRSTSRCSAPWLIRLRRGLVGLVLGGPAGAGRCSPLPTHLRCAIGPIPPSPPAGRVRRRGGRRAAATLGRT